jgi:hypothetical protein
VYTTGMNATLPDIADMTDDAKRRLLKALIYDLAGTEGKVVDVGGTESLYVYTPPPNARERAQKAIRERTPEYQAELDRRAATPEDSVGVEEWLRMHRGPMSE